MFVKYSSLIFNKVFHIISRNINQLFLKFIAQFILCYILKIVHDSFIITASFLKILHKLFSEIFVLYSTILYIVLHPDICWHMLTAS